ncbi:hypothetical protein DEO72_LG7g1891 [Vigna unguiculata]|uniref:Uncharacterized protein n=1 Tax=Vigna unguiculata TaxID=3917 RepID=A0A4D6MIQ4_VIGUN|nr:hypothetical protein DEO72_LG7g1891 [Vigna unguiculata]
MNHQFLRPLPGGTVHTARQTCSRRLLFPSLSPGGTFPSARRHLHQNLTILASTAWRKAPYRQVPRVKVVLCSLAIAWRLTDYCQAPYQNCYQSFQPNPAPPKFTKLFWVSRYRLAVRYNPSGGVSFLENSRFLHTS